MCAWPALNAFNLLCMFFVVWVPAHVDAKSMERQRLPTLSSGAILVAPSLQQTCLLCILLVADAHVYSVICDCCFLSGRRAVCLHECYGVLFAVPSHCLCLIISIWYLVSST